MKWYHVFFSSTEINNSLDQSFIQEIIQFIHKWKYPQGLVLYDLKFKLDEGLAFYISTPPLLEYELKKILSLYTVQPVSRPNLNLLQVIAGKKEIFLD